MSATDHTAARATFLVSRFGKFEDVTTEMAQRELLELGEPAIPALLAALADPKNGWTAAKVLGQIGVAAPEVIAALRPLASSLWHAMALGMLGDLDWLSEQEPAVACLGLTARLKAVCYEGASPPGLSYAPLEAWLDRSGTQGLALVEKELEPGRSYIGIQAADVDEAVRGLASGYAVIRWHAAAVLRNRRLGKEAGRRALPALALALADPHPFVRRIAVLSIEAWKSAAKPFYKAVEKLVDDPDETARFVAARLLGR